MSWLGKKWSKEHRELMSKAHKGISSGNKGKKHPYKGRPTKDRPWSEIRRKAQLARNGAPYKSSLRISRVDGLRPTIVGGKEYSPLWREIRKVVYKRDNYKCQECGVHCHNDKRINAHHIDYDINNNDLSNLITLCASCHMKTNYKRADWIIRYTEIGRKSSN
jgi:hypothetical protein